MGGTQSRVEEHDSTPSEAEKSVPEVKLSNGFLARLEERSQAGSLIGERSPETPPENVLLDEDHIQQQRDAQAARAQQEEDRARQLRVIEDEAASRLSKVIRAVSSGTPESDGRRKQGPCSSELQEAFLCFRAQQLTGKGHIKCTDLVNALEACTSRAPRERQ